MNRTSRVVAAVLLVVTGGLTATGLAYADDNDDHDGRGHYYNFDHQGYYRSNRVEHYEGNKGCHSSDYNNDSNGVDSDNGCDLTRYDNRGYNGNSSPESEFGHGRRDGDEPLGNGLFESF
jgi:hypothetical protein